MNNTTSDLEQYCIMPWTILYWILNTTASKHYCIRSWTILHWTEQYYIRPWAILHLTLKNTASEAEEYCIRGWTMLYQTLNNTASDPKQYCIRQWTILHQTLPCREEMVIFLGQRWGRQTMQKCKTAATIISGGPENTAYGNDIKCYQNISWKTQVKQKENSFSSMHTTVSNR